jgi:nicotinate-nucleotide adenylyltransferase
VALLSDIPLQPIGIFGGTFDPVHFGHLRPMLELKERLGLERVHLVPCNIPPHRGEPHASAEQRCAMLQLAIEGEEGLLLDRRELERPGPSYMVDTLKSLREEYGAQRPLCLIIGGDAFLGLPSWYHWQELVQLAHIVVAHRPGWELEEGALEAPLRELLAHHRLDAPPQLGAAPAGGVLLQAVTQLDISATVIRRLVASGDSANFLLPQPVWDYIRRHNLYRSV